MTKTFLAVVAVLGAVTRLSAHDCGDATSVAEFLSYSSGTRDFTDDELKTTFTPIFGCLEAWVEDGGEKDGVPLQEWATAYDPPRVVYRAKAMELIDAVILLDGVAAKGRLGSWILSRIENWPEPVKLNAWKTLADLHERKAIPLLRKEAGRSGGIGKTVAWEQLARLSPETIVSDLEALAKTDEDYKAIGFALLSVDSLSIIPALERIVRLDPGKASRYTTRIRELREARR
jgi:hypothetical protein